LVGRTRLREHTRDRFGKEARVIESGDNDGYSRTKRGNVRGRHFRLAHFEVAACNTMRRPSDAQINIPKFISSGINGYQ